MTEEISVSENGKINQIKDVLIINDTNTELVNDNRYSEMKDSSVSSGLRPNNESRGNTRSVNELRRKGSHVEELISHITNHTVERIKEAEGVTRSQSCHNIYKAHNPCLLAKWGSLDHGLEQRPCRWELLMNIGSGESSRRIDDGSEDRDTVDYLCPDGGIVDELEFQTSLKNERNHFLLTDMLMEAVEFMYAEEYFHRERRSGRTRADIMRYSTYSESEDRLSSGPSPFNTVDSDTSTKSTSFSNADMAVMTFIYDTQGWVNVLNVNDGRDRTLPSSLRTLLDRLEKQSLLSGSLDSVSSACASSIQLTKFKQSIVRYNGSMVEATDSAVMSWPVGGCPVLSPDMSLPTYIVSRSSLITKRADILYSQQNTCPGCHFEFSPVVARRLRLCRYYCLYFCSVCHNNTLMLIPAHILTKWDFTMLLVSRPASDLLHLIHDVPLFTLDNFVDNLQSSLRVLSSTCRLRRQARILLNFIETCRYGLHLTDNTKKLPSHWFSPLPSLFSIADFQMMESGKMEIKLRQVVRKYMEHISICKVCQARGFICELCDNKSEVIFPFEIDVVHQCDQCGACFHSKCYHPPCRRCERLLARNLKPKEDTSLDSLL